MQAKLYPNLNNGNFTLAYDLKNNNEATVQIVDVTGKMVFTTDIDNINSILQINTNQLQSGIYFYKAVTGDKIHQNKLVIIK